MPKTREHRNTHDLVRAAREGLEKAGIDRHDTFNIAKAAMALLLDSLNSGSEKDAIPGTVEGITNTHRYLQGKGVFALLEALGNLSKLPTDARNEHAYAACGEIREALKHRIYWKD